MTTRPMRQIYEAFRIGDSLTDAEVEAGIQHFEQLERLAFAVGAEFWLAAGEARRVAITLTGFRKARQEAGQWRP